MGITKKTVAFYSPYLDILGGGEKYLLAIAAFLSKDFAVDIIWDNSETIRDAEAKFNLNLGSIKLVNIPKNIAGLSLLSSRYRIFFHQTDASLFYSLSPKSILIIQSPVHIPSKSLLNSIKISRYQDLICYSDYVKGFIQQKWPRPVTVIPPPVKTADFHSLAKENIILSVGRFFPWLHSKRQDILLEAFKQLLKDKTLWNWKLVLIGSCDRGAQSYLDKITRAAKGFPVEIITAAPFNILQLYYARAKIYWHAAGYGADLAKHPEFAEHFGISTVEAMASGCVPLVFAAGGQKEVISNGINGIYWTDINQLIDNTKMVIIDKDKYKTLSSNAKKSSKIYDEPQFQRQIENLIRNL